MNSRKIPPIPEVDHIAFGQNGEDIVLLRAFRDQDFGFYVDVGSGHPVEGSITKNLYDRGWRGIDIEPLPRMAALLRAARPRSVVVEAAVAPTRGRATLLELPDNWGMSTLVDNIAKRHESEGWSVVPTEVETLPLDDILEEHDAPLGFDVLKIDVEGAEDAVLASVDLQRWRPRVIVIEATEPASVTLAHHTWEWRLLEVGYELRLFDGLNQFFSLPDDDGLSSRLAVPASVFDRFVHLRWWRHLPVEVRHAASGGRVEIDPDGEP